MTSPRLPLVKAQQSFLSGIRLSRELHGPKVKVTAPPIKKTEVYTLIVYLRGLNRIEYNMFICQLKTPMMGSIIT